MMRSSPATGAELEGREESGNQEYRKPQCRNPRVRRASIRAQAHQAPLQHMGARDSKWDALRHVVRRMRREGVPE